MNETQLLEAFRESRSEAAFAELVRRYAGLVYSVAKRRLANSALAEDITQIVFIRLAKTFPRVRNHAELAAWLHRTTVHVTVDTWRSESRRCLREQHALVMESTATENKLWEEISPQLDEALNQLNDEDRQAVLLRFFGGKTMREVGVTMGVSEDAAKMRISRAVDRLRSQLGAPGAACTAAVLGTLLVERAAEAAPGHLVSQLAALKLPAVAGASGLLGALLETSKLNLAMIATVCALIGAGVVYQIHSSSAGMTREEPSSPLTTPAKNKFLNTVKNLSIPASASPGQTLSSRSIRMMFKVVDNETGAGLARAEINVAYFGVGGATAGDHLVTDVDGVAAIPEPNDPSKDLGMNVFVRAENHVPKIVSFPSAKKQPGPVKNSVRGSNGVRLLFENKQNADTDVDEAGSPENYLLKLDPALTARGWVIDESGAPVGGVRIMIQRPGNKPGQKENVDFMYCDVTNRDDGSWSYGFVPKDYTEEIRFVLKKPGYAVTFPVVPVAKTGLEKLTLVINRGFTIQGRISDAQGQPIAKVSVQTVDENREQRKSTKTDESGVYVIAGLAGEMESGTLFTLPELQTNSDGSFVISGTAGQGPFHAEVAVQREGFASVAQRVELLAATNLVDFTLLPGNIFRGKVVDELGGAITNAVVQTDYDFQKQKEKRFQWQTHTDANGHFEWGSAPGDSVCYWFEAQGYETIRGMSLSAENSEQTITLKRNGAK